MQQLEANERLSGILLDPAGRSFNIVVLYIVYKTIEANDNITLNKLKRVLDSDLMLKDSVVDGAVASLSSRSVYNAVTRWVRPKSAPEITHLHVKKASDQEDADFSKWLVATTEEFPELLLFNPTVLLK